MKKKFLLAVIPALMVLTSCAGAGQKVEVKNDNLFVEDTLAHEEIFGESKIEFIDNVKTPLKAPSGPFADPVYGVQYQDAGENVHMRFIAAVWLNNLSMDVEWTRTMYKGHGNGEQSGHVFKAEADKECTKAYTSLANGSEDPLTIAQINSQYGDGDDYNYFIVYTMLNIPKTTYDDYSIRANIKLGGLASGKGVAATVGQTAYATFDMSLTGHFISGKIGGTHYEGSPEYDGEHPKGDNNAVYYEFDLSVGDTFALAYYDSANNVFLLNGTGRDGDNGYFCSNEKKTMTSKYAGSFTIYLNGDDTIFMLANFKLTRKIYVDVSEVTWWGETYGRKTALYRFDGSKSADFVVMSKVAGEDNLYVTSDEIDPDEYCNFLVVDYNGATPAWDGGVVNKTKNSGTIAMNSKDCIKIKNQQDGYDENKWLVEWATR